MVTSLARQSIIIKSQTQTSIVLGNYECGYCLGLLSKMAGIEADDSYQDMISWYEAVMTQLKDFESDDTQLMEVLRMMRVFEPSPQIDEQVRELYHMGFTEECMWKM